MRQFSPKKPPIPVSKPLHPNPFWQSYPRLYAFWKFCRPHTIIGTSLSVIGLYLMASASLEVWQPALELGLGAVPLTLLACLCGNVYIVGLNQLEDIEIDKINKPHLPLASGEFSRPQAQRIVGLTGLLAILLALLGGPFLMATIGISLMLGTAYSLPPLRLKRFPFWASFCIFTVRGIIVNLGLFLHFHWVLQGSVRIPDNVWLLTAFILGFTLAIALFKDIPDLEGDRRYHITTFTIRLGARAVFNLSRWILTFCYVGVIVSGLFLPNINRLFLITTHTLALGLFWYRSQRVDLHDKSAIARCYQFIWKLFFLEYLMFPLACLLV